MAENLLSVSSLFNFHFLILQHITDETVCFFISDGSLLPLVAARLGAKHVSNEITFLISYTRVNWNKFRNISQLNLCSHASLSDQA